MIHNMKKGEGGQGVDRLSAPFLYDWEVFMGAILALSLPGYRLYFTKPCEIRKRRNDICSDMKSKNRTTSQDESLPVSGVEMNPPNPVSVPIRPPYVILMGIMLFLFFFNQCFYRLELGECMFRYVLPRCDYASYVRASNEILQGRSPYYEKTNYIYTPLLAVIMIPLTRFSEVIGFSIWTVISVIAFGYGAYRSGLS